MISGKHKKGKKAEVKSRREGFRDKGKTLRKEEAWSDLKASSSQQDAKKTDAYESKKTELVWKSKYNSSVNM